MPITHPGLQLQRLAGAIPVWHGRIIEADLLPVCESVRDGGGRLVALWGSDERVFGAGFSLHVVLVNEAGLICLTLPLSAVQPDYPDISAIFPAASRMQRAAYDLLGIRARDACDQRKWLRHAAWSEGAYPLRKDFDHPHFGSSLRSPPPHQGEEAIDRSPAENGTQTHDDYPFVQVEGQGVHEIPVGPVHAGIIEPGHFRFSVIGERVLRLEERLGYVHKGIEKLFEINSLYDGCKLAGRVSGDSTVAYAWAYAMAAESIANVTPPDIALWMRALFLERERISNHLGDLGYLGNDVAFSFGFAQFWILKEQLLRNNAELFGHRYLMDAIIPGGVRAGIDESGKQTLLAECEMLEREVRLLRSVYEEHAGVQDRFIGTGSVAPELAARLGLCGLAGRASSQAWDMRVQCASAPYGMLDVQMATHRNGDVAARVIVRFDEIFESLRLQREIMANLLGGDDLAYPVSQLPANGFGIGMVEGWRGEVMVAIHTYAEGNPDRVHPHDPSWQNWPVLEHAIIGNIVPDFPLINKSFNLSYSGHDL
ncbi:MAG: NADH-quinone oxidoreductase subunit C [Proteobacteria bacterium]|nr:NADH-quinone oxidoreductase subunit C [Pseudomonadota bacterium]